ncbi:MAG: GAF domain-containing protein [Bacteroidales bacterium]
MTPRDYQAIAVEVRSAVAQEADTGRLLERLVALLHGALPDYTWVGVYLVEGSDLVLGPFVGNPSPHTRIPVGRGICGAAAEQRQTIVVDEVGADERYLACSLETRSEIVVPIMAGDRVVGELDIDSDRPAAFGPADRTLLEEISALVADRVANLVDRL